VALNRRRVTDQEEQMQTKKLLCAAMMLLGIVLVVPALSGAAATKTLTATLKGKEEVPGPGDKNGKGEAVVTTKAKKGKVCFELEFSQIENPVAGHIHKGASGVAGAVKVTLFEDSAGIPGPTAEGCVGDLRKKLVRNIGRTPEKYYVNLHNGEFPDGAIRGQLQPATP
jgi:hypothetical protein